MYDRGERLRKLRKKRKLSQEQVAQRTGINRANLSHYENNTATPSIDVVEKLALLYRVPTDYILGLDNRSFISLDGLSARDRNLVESVVEVMISDLKLRNL